MHENQHLTAHNAAARSPCDTRQTEHTHTHTHTHRALIFGSAPSSAYSTRIKHTPVAPLQTDAHTVLCVCVCPECRCYSTMKPIYLCHKSILSLSTSLPHSSFTFTPHPLLLDRRVGPVRSVGRYRQPTARASLNARIIIIQLECTNTQSACGVRACENVCERLAIMVPGANAGLIIRTLIAVALFRRPDVRPAPGAEPNADYPHNQTNYAPGIKCLNSHCVCVCV